jgi:hypothetical protein
VDGKPLEEWMLPAEAPAEGGSRMIDKELLEILACPKCKSEVRLDEAAQRIICTSPTCGLRYPIRDGIPVMLIDEAEGGPGKS